MPRELRFAGSVHFSAPVGSSPRLHSDHSTEEWRRCLEMLVYRSDHDGELRSVRGPARQAYPRSVPELARPGMRRCQIRLWLRRRRARPCSWICFSLPAPSDSAAGLIRGQSPRSFIRSGGDGGGGTLSTTRTPRRPCRRDLTRPQHDVHITRLPCANLFCDKIPCVPKQQH